MQINLQNLEQAISLLRPAVDEAKEAGLVGYAGKLDMLLTGITDVIQVFFRAQLLGRLPDDVSADAQLTPNGTVPTEQPPAAMAEVQIGKAFTDLFGFLLDLAAEVRAMVPGPYSSSTPQPTAALRQGCVPVGKAPEDLRKLHTLRQRYQHSANAYMQAANFAAAASDEDRQEHMGRANLLSFRAMLCDALLLQQFRERFGLNDAVAVGITPDWTVFWYSPAQGPAI